MRSFRNITQEQQTDYLWSVMNADDERNIDEIRKQLFGKGHISEAHYNLTAEDMVHRTISELRPVSSFHSQEDAITFMECVLYSTDCLYT